VVLRSETVADRPKPVNSCSELLATNRPLVACGLTSFDKLERDPRYKALLKMNLPE
jgi:hypothetical protein